MAGPSPLLGYNTNVRHKGKLFHIQTEDSGVRRPHVITHLFADGGRIIASKKTSYAEIVGAEDLNAQVKSLMREQHKAMFIALRDGHYDEGEETPEPAPRESLDVDALEAAADRLSKESVSGAPAPEQSPEPKPHEPKPHEPKPASQPSIPTSAASAPAGGGAPMVALDGVRTSTPDAPREPRYQPTQPTQVARSTPEPAAPRKRPESIFGSELLSEKSLDEVILSYLAEDLDDDA